MCGHCTLGAQWSQWVLVRWEEQLFELVAMKFMAMVVVAVVVEVQVVVAEECRYVLV